MDSPKSLAIRVTDLARLTALLGPLVVELLSLLAALYSVIKKILEVLRDV